MMMGFNVEGLEIKFNFQGFSVKNEVCGNFLIHKPFNFINIIV